nr:hypothetical protein [uncultured Limnohabitans sp.]
MKIISIFTLLSLVGCAIQTTPRGYIDFKVDGAELFGSDVGSFKLEDGSEGRLRVLNGEYSVKLQNRLRVLPIANATSARIFNSQLIGGRMILVVEASERNCSNRTHLLSIKESEVLSWAMGDCRQQPKVTFSKDEATFDYTYGSRTTRFTYTNQRLLKSELSTLAATAYRTQATTQSEHSRYLPSPPHTFSVVSTSANSPPIGAGETVGLSKLTKSASAAPVPATVRNLTFSSQEQKPVRIVLDR